MTPTELRALAAQRREKLGDKETRLTRALDGAADKIEQQEAELMRLYKKHGYAETARVLGIDQQLTDGSKK